MPLTVDRHSNDITGTCMGSTHGPAFTNVSCSRHFPGCHPWGQALQIAGCSTGPAGLSSASPRWPRGPAIGACLPDCDTLWPVFTLSAGGSGKAVRLPGPRWYVALSSGNSQKLRKCRITWPEVYWVYHPLPTELLTVLSQPWNQAEIERAATLVRETGPARPRSVSADLPGA